MRNVRILMCAVLLGAVVLSLLIFEYITPKSAETSGETERTESVMTEDQEPAAAELTEAQEITQSVADPDLGKIRISELMLRNKATLPDEEDEFPDWIELENISEEEVEISGWRLSDREGEAGWAFSETVIPPGGRIVVFASGKDLPGHCSFSLSAGETVYLYTRQNELADRALCPDGESDRSWVPDGQGGMTECRYPTPGEPNTSQGYDTLMEERSTDSPLQINEVCTYNTGNLWGALVGDSDWVELKNVSSLPLQLADYYLSDDDDERLLFRLPEQVLEPGKLVVFRCDKSASAMGSAPLCPAFSLDSTAERLYLSRADGSLADYVSLRDIPFEGSFGRRPEQNGWFFFLTPSPDAENAGGLRRISEMPSAQEPDGVFNDTESVTVTLKGKGEIHYTTDSSYPTAASPLYTGPITVEKTCVVRAISIEEGGFPSRALTLNYFLNENHSLPVLSLVSDNDSFRWMYNNRAKGVESPCSLSFYEDGGCFTIPCGVKLNGETSLVLTKKNLSIRFRGAYGQAPLQYDMYGGGVTEFDNLLLRAGQDHYAAVIRNELCTELALDATDKVVVSRSRYGVLYIDGKYSGIYAIDEKMNESMYAHWAGVSKDSVTVETPLLDMRHQMYWEVIDYAENHDLSVPEYYQEICSHLDVESLADWLIVEGVFANNDLSFANVRYCRSTENDGKWRVMLYDLDAAFYRTDDCFGNLLSYWARDKRQVGGLLNRLLRNPDFRALVLTRAGELLEGPLSNERILEKIDLLAGMVEPEIPRDYKFRGMNPDDWPWNVEFLRSLIRDNDWSQVCVQKLCGFLQVTPEERELYFGNLAGGNDGNE